MDAVDVTTPTTSCTKLASACSSCMQFSSCMQWGRNGLTPRPPALAAHDTTGARCESMHAFGNQPFLRHNVFLSSSQSSRKTNDRQTTDRGWLMSRVVALTQPHLAGRHS